MGGADGLRSLRGLWGTLVAAVLITCLGTLGSVVFHGWWNDTVADLNADRLDRSVASRVSRVTDNLTRYLDALRAVGAFIQTGTDGHPGRAVSATMTAREQIVGRGIFEVFPDNPDTGAALPGSLSQAERVTAARSTLGANSRSTGQAREAG
ncbi:hypothetical protein AB0M54_46870 [Actinoplanes sp. NPDC051470]|uniref:hypothetical protein n=1 Tax=Actinoplanes sp. NPDC051470 TaxID=3157224 RepID=UPI003442B616